MSDHQAAMLGWMQEIAPYGILTTDAELRIQSWNEWLETFSGLAAPLVLGRSLLEVFPDLRTRKLDEHFRRALTGEVIVLSAAFHTFLLPFPSTVRSAGSVHMQQTARIAPLSLDGRICGTITIIEDVTQREVQAAMLARQHEREQLLSSALAHLLRTRDPESVVRELFPKVADYLKVDTFLNYLVDPDGEQLRLHAAAGISDAERQELSTLPVGHESLTGLAALERRPVLANHLQSSSDPTFASQRALGLRAAACHPLLVSDRVIGTLTFAMRNRDAFTTEELELLATVSQYVAVALDRVITDAALRKAQEELSEHARELESKVHERTAKLQDTIVQLESFSYTVAHDLRAPIRAFRGYAQLLLEETAAEVPEKWRHYLSRIDRAANRLDAITRDLLQFSTISREDVQLTTVDVGELLHDIQLLRPQLQEDVLSVEGPIPAVLAQRTLLQHCLSNLLDNAVKFVKPGTRPQILVRSEWIDGPAGRQPAPLRPFNLAAVPPPLGSVSNALASSEREAPRRVRIWVQDNGIGIAPDAHEKIFGIFERLNAPDKYEGTGIGLAIVARAMQRMGGRCGVESGSGEGSRFWLELLPG